MAASVAGMKTEHRKLLRSNRIKLVKDLEPLKLIYLLSSVLSEEDEEEIRACNSRNDRAEFLMDMLPKRGEKAFEVFARALQEKQPHLAKVLLDGSEISLSSIEEDNHSMTIKHREILRSSREMLKGMDLNRIIPLMTVFLDDIDTGRIYSKNSGPERFDEFMALLPRKGPKAFEHFVRVLEGIHPEYGRMLMKEAGMTPIATVPLGHSTNPTNNGEGLPAPKQVITKPEELVVKLDPVKLSRFYEEMNKNDAIHGSGWRRLYKELSLPPGAEDKIQTNTNPAFVVLDSWCKREGRKATVSALFGAVSRTGRGDCVMILEDDLGCKVDCTDGPMMEGLTAKAKGMKIGNEKVPEVKPTRLRDLERVKLERVANLIDNDAQLSSRVRCKLRGAMGASVPMLQVLLDANNRDMAIIELAAIVRGCPKGSEKIAEMKKFLPVGVTGPVLIESMKVADIPYSKRAALTRALTVDGNWKILAEYFGIDNDKIKYLDQRKENPADGTLEFWEQRRVGTVGELYDILVKLELALIAEKL